MKLRDEVKKLWLEAFDDSPEWVDAFFTRVYSDDQAVVGRKDGKVVSSLLLQPYRMAFHGSELGVGYICGASTRRQYRGLGYMSRLLETALRAARERGDSFVTLIPAHDWLYDYYRRCGFETVFFVNADRYTSAHGFHTDRLYTVVDDPYSDSAFEAFRRLEAMHPCRVLHTRADYLNILDDLRLDGGHAAIVADDEGIAGMAFATLRDGCVVVSDAMGRDADARTGALRCLRDAWPDLPFKVLSYPADGDRRTLYPRGMAYTVDAFRALEAMAAENPSWRCCIRLRDSHIAENNAVFVVSKGRVAIDHDPGRRRYDAGAPEDRRIDFDIDQRQLTAILFSSPSMGNILGVPSVRPHMSLMLD